MIRGTSGGNARSNATQNTVVIANTITTTTTANVTVAGRFNNSDNEPLLTFLAAHTQNGPQSNSSEGPF